MALLRELFFLHYRGSALLSTFHAHWMAEALLWPALPDDYGMQPRPGSRRMLLERHLDPHGYVSCAQHEGLGHPEGWPFPFYAQSGGAGWQFLPHLYRDISIPALDVSAFRLRNCTTILRDFTNGWRIRISQPRASLEFPPLAVNGLVASFFLIKWSLSNLPANAVCHLAFRANNQRHFSAGQRIVVPFSNTSQFVHVWLQLLDHPHWKTTDTLAGLRLVFDNAAGAELTFAYACTALDTRHNINNPIFVSACCQYAARTGDTNFLAAITPRVRRAMAYALSEFRVAEHGCVYTPWLGHDGSSGVVYDHHGKKIIRHGYGIGNNYYDLLPFGGRDAYATAYLFNALRRLAVLEESVACHPEWGLCAPPAPLQPPALRALATTLFRANTQFWNYATGRFATRDLSGKLYDYGFTFLNCEAVHYGYATPAQAEQIMQWLEGTRIVSNDTSRGPDIYHWQFGPRATTRRNIDYYSYGWTHPETIPFGGQIQDGGAVLGFSYHDLMLRLRTRGADNAWQRLRDILAWFDRVQSEGGYRAYYITNNPGARGSLQGGGTAGGLGFDCEFFESVLVPQVMLYGFMGVQPRMDGLIVRPRLPRAWPSLTISNVYFHGATLTLSADTNTVGVAITDGTLPAQRQLFLPHGTWHAAYYTAGGTVPVQQTTVTISARQPGVPCRLGDSTRIICTRAPHRTAPRHHDCSPVRR